MKNKIYSLILTLSFFGLLTARAQDSTSCNARFATTVNGLQGHFWAIDSAAGVQQFWSFGDNSQTGDGPFASVTHTYAHPGAYTVVHLVHDSARNCYDSSSQVISIGDTTPPPPTCSVSITFSHDSTKPNQPYFFMAHPNPATAVSYVWRINDSIAGNLDTLTRVFRPGTYVVCVSALTTQGCLSQSCVTIVAGDTTTPPPPTCSITFTYSHDSTRPGQPYVFFANANLAGATHDSITWRINDTIVGRGDTLTRVLRTGTYYICANLVTSLGCTSQFCQTIVAGDTTTPPPPPTCSVTISSFHDSTQPNQPYFFIAHPALAGATADTVTWTINDSIAATGDSLIRVFRPGTYTVCARLVTNLGCTSQACFTFRAGDTTTTPPPPTCSVTYTYSHDSTRANQPYFFQAHPVLGGAASYTILWTANGDSVGRTDSLIRVFQPGVYTVCANLVTDSGCRSQFCETITVTDSTVTPPDSTGTPPPSDTTVRFIRCYPNPAYSMTNILLRLEHPAVIYVRVYNSMGSQVGMETYSGLRGANIITIPLGKLQQGIYYIELQYGTEIRRSRIQKL